MIKSLTGFGNVEINEESNQINITIRTVNSRFLDVKFRGIDLNPKLEAGIRKEVQKLLLRGNVQIQIYNKNGKKGSSAIKFNREKYEQIENMIHIIQKDYGRRLDLSNLISFNGLIDGTEYIEITDTTLLKGVSDAIKQVNEMRQEEGASIGVDIKNRINFILKSLWKLEKLSGKYIQEQNSKYIDKIKSLLDDFLFSSFSGQ